MKRHKNNVKDGKVMSLWLGSSRLKRLHRIADKERIKTETNVRWTDIARRAIEQYIERANTLDNLGIDDALTDGEITK